MKWWIAVLVLGVLMTASGAGLRKSDDGPGEVTCGSEVMRPGDVCEETRRGVVTDTYTYEEKRRDEEQSASAYARTGRWVVLGIGIGLVLAAAVGIVLTKRRRGRRPLTTADLHLGRQAAWQPHHQRWPPQHQWQAQPAHNHPPHAGGPPAGPAGHQWGPNQNTETPYMFRPGTTGWK